jgi:hypothetical protein
MDADNPGTADTGRADRLAQIRALLAKAEATEFPAEAEAFTAKAMQLIARYAIDEALLWATDSSNQEPTELRLVLVPPYLGPKAYLASGVAQACGCQAIRLNAENTRTQTMSIWGFPSELTLVEELLTSLMVQMAAALLASESDRQVRDVGRGGASTANWRRSFMVGFAEEAIARVRASRERAAAEERVAPRRGTSGQRSSVAVALRDRDDAVQAEFRRQFPHVRRSRTSAGSSRSGRSRGRAAGKRADVGGPRLGTRGALPK